ncbi:MAG: radical SAM protein [Candidatus Woesearchaeota archaeon]
MKVLFIYPNLKGNDVNIGISLLSAILKEKSHEVKVIHINESLGIPFDFELIKKEIISFNPDLIGISANTTHFSMGIKIAKFIKDKMTEEVPIVFGGVHTTLNPDEILKFDCIDMLVVGEGEEAIVELVEKLGKKEDISEIQNLWLKKNDKIIKNPLRRFIPLDKLPPMDVSIWDFQKVIDSKKGWVNVSLNRGCLNNCTYCFNKSYKTIYSKYCINKTDNYLRIGDYTTKIKEIKDILNSYEGVKIIRFVDDDFLLNDSIIEFMNIFKKEINLPFVINAHINSVNEEKLIALKKNNCHLLGIGVECANENIRKEILNRHMSNQQIREKIKLIKKIGVRLMNYIMFGFPTETKQNVIETLKLNSESQPDIVRSSIFFPCEGTELYSICEKLELISHSKDQNLFTYFEKSVLNFNDDFKLFLEKVQKYLDCYLNYYNENLSSKYGALIAMINNLSREQWGDEEVHKEIQKMRESISQDLCSKKTFHYAMRFTSYFAVRIN